MLSPSESNEKGAARPRPGAAARRRAAVETFSRHQEALRRTARRYSLCADDAEDALQRGLEILLAKAPSDEPRELIRWTQTVVKHEALAVRRERERILAGPAATPSREGGEEDWVARIPARGEDPSERVERREAVARSREALQALKPQELRALTLLAEGYSYAEIGELTGFSKTKVNRCLAEGRERFRRLLASSESGERCRELRPLLSGFCDGELGAAEAQRLREHLRACAGCRATLRAYRAAPGAAVALLPALPLGRSLLERAHQALAGLLSRFADGGAPDAALAQAATGGGSRGLGVAALAKLAAVCAGTAGGAVACVATGVVPPLGVGHGAPAAAVHEQLGTAAASSAADSDATIPYVPEPAAPPSEKPAAEAATHEAPPAEAAPEPSRIAAAPAAAGAVEYAPPPPAASSASGASGANTDGGGGPSGDAGGGESGGGNPAGEFGP